jgi:hypothetical protein
MTSFRKFHSIAALCGDGLRPELQALFERLAVDPHSELFVRADGMVQSGPDPISAKAPLAQNAGETRTSEADSAPPVLPKEFSVRKLGHYPRSIVGCDRASREGNRDGLLSEYNEQH